MHETLSVNYIGHIDEFYEKDGNVHISGWVVTRIPNAQKFIEYVVSTDEKDVIFWGRNVRQDVADFYTNVPSDIDTLNCGFSICIPTPSTDIIKISTRYIGSADPLFELNLNTLRTPNTSQLVDETINVEYNQPTPGVIVVDNFYKDPDAVRTLALAQTFEPDIRYHKGNRTTRRFLPQGMKEVFESLVGKKIKNWTAHGYNGVFQYCTAEDPLVYHVDSQSYAAAIYLTKYAPLQTGTSFYQSKATGLRSLTVEDPLFDATFLGGFYDKTKFDLVDSVGNVYNRLVIWDARKIHAASEYFGTCKEDSRLFHLFFFDIEE